VAAQEATPRLADPLEEPAPIAASAQELPEDAGPLAVRAAGPVLDDVEVGDAPEEQLSATGWTPRRLCRRA